MSHLDHSPSPVRTGSPGQRFGAVQSLVSVLAMGFVLAIAACAGNGGSTDGNAEGVRDLGGRDPLIVLNDKEEAGNVRAEAARTLWARAQGQGDAGISAAREELKKMVWRGGAPQSAREAALECLFSDTRPEGVADTANLLRLRLPTEPNFGVLKLACAGIAQRAADPAWRTSAMGLVRSWARKLPSPPDNERPERAALAAMFPDRPVEETVFAVFVDPVSFGAKTETQASAAAPDSSRRLRQSAWDLLGRIDPRGDRRAALLSGALDTRDDPGLQTLVIAARDLRVVPLTGSELEWVQDLRDSKEPADRRWWDEVVRAVRPLGGEQAAGLQTRHLEPVHWAAVHHPEWLTMTRAGLTELLASRLHGRRAHRVGAGSGNVFTIDNNRLSDWQDQLTFGDVLAVLVIDLAVQDPAIAGELFRQAEADRNDPSTEWGGCLFDSSQRVGIANPAGANAAKPAASASATPEFLAVTYPARPSQRVNDRTFVASDEMFSLGGRSLAHYHMHVQSQTNDEYAGPGAGDRDYADLHNRNCVVFTSVRKGVLNADYYQRGGACIDLGEIVEMHAPAGR